MKKFIISMGIGGLLAAGMLLGAGNAHADDDGDFLYLLSTDHNIFIENREIAIEDARQVCSYLESGKSRSQVQSILMALDQLNAHDGSWYVASAIEVYCPWERNTPGALN
jgi:hypothetical protein